MGSAVGIGGGLGVDPTYSCPGKPGTQHCCALGTESGVLSTYGVSTTRDRIATIPPRRRGPMAVPGCTAASFRCRLRCLDTAVTADPSPPKRGGCPAPRTGKIPGTRRLRRGPPCRERTPTGAGNSLSALRSCGPASNAGQRFTSRKPLG